MRTVFTIVLRDLKRLIRVPSAWVIIAGLTFIPALYAWFNIFGFWNPYGNTESIRVAVANEDRGADNALIGKMNLGDQIIAKLKDNKQLGWRFVNKSDAMQCVESGDCYAAIVIPRNFSEELSNVVTDMKTRPQLDYYVNEKANAVAPKITDIGADTVDRQVNSTFVSTVSGVISDIVNKTSMQVQQQSNKTAGATAQQLQHTKENLEQVSDTIDFLLKELKNAPATTQAVRTAITQAQDAAKSASTGLSQASSLLTGSQGKLNTFVSSTSSAMDKGSSLISQATSQATNNVASISSGIVTASGYTQNALDGMKASNERVSNIIEDLRTIQVPASLQPALDQLITSLETQNTEVSQTITGLETLNTQVTNTAKSTQDSASQFNTTTQTTLNSLGTARNTITTGSIPQLNSGLSSLAMTSGILSGSLSGQNIIVSQLNNTLNELDGITQSTTKALQQTDKLISQLIEKIDRVHTDISALTNATSIADVVGSDGNLDVKRIANFMLSPTVLNTHTLYPINSYGSGMAPLFTSLSLWVGAFMLMVIPKLEVDDDDLEGIFPSAWQKYVARFIVLAFIAFGQGLVCTVGDLILGVQTVNPFVFVLTGIITSLVYLSVTYSLSTTFMHVGKGLCVALVIVQIPGASGLYPIEMMPSFFRALYPFFPFTYTIDAFRETIGGFYDGHYLKMIGMLLLFTAISFFIGIVIRPWMTNLNRLFARELEQSDMIISEEVMLPDREHDTTTILQVLADKGGFQQQINNRAQRFNERYPKLLRGALIAGLVVPIVLFITFSFTNGTKVIALATWCIWILLIMGFLMIVEYIQDSLNRQVTMSDMSDGDLQHILYERGMNRSLLKKKRQKMEKTIKQLTHPHEGRHSA